MKVNVNVSIIVGRSTLDYYSNAFVKKSLEKVIKEKLVDLPPTYTIEKIKVEEV